MSVLLLLCCDARDTDGLCGAQLLTGHAEQDAARAYAARQGWALHDGHDRCPRHHPDPPPRLPLAAVDSESS